MRPSEFEKVLPEVDQRHWHGTIRPRKNISYSENIQGILSLMY
jgi:hypothetical protein